MAKYEFQITLAGSAVSLFTASGLANSMVNAFFVQAKSSNTHSHFIGDSSVNTSGNACTEVAAPVAGSTPDPFSVSMSDGSTSIDLREWWVYGTSGEKLNVKVIQR